jgi:hypothetical protein
MSFKYPPLPKGDSLRLLTLSPGEFEAPLSGTLHPIAFSSRPKYLALSYTWADPDEIHAQLPTSQPPDQYGDTVAQEPSPPSISVNGSPLPIGHNLALALLHIRSTSHELTLWVDAICINQADIHERNSQVALMAFIFTRAAAVVAWLGVPSPPDVSDAELAFRRMRRDWIPGESRMLAEAVAEGFIGGRPGKGEKRKGGAHSGGHGSGLTKDKVFSSKLMQVHTNLYWRRLWVVQEVCLPRVLVFVHGGFLWTDEQVSTWQRTPSACSPQMRQLLDARAGRFLESTTNFESLIERFAQHGCGELRDRVFGVVGMANDVDSFPDGDSADGGAIGEARSASGGLWKGWSRGGTPEFKIDYAMSFYSIWRDAVTFMHFQAQAKDDAFGSSPAQLADERRIRVVRFAGVVQNAFEGLVEAEIVDGHVPLSAVETLEIPKGMSMPKILAKGYIAGEVLYLGPSYADFVGSYAAQKRWVSAWRDFYSDETDLLKLRQMEEEYATDLIDYDEVDLARVQPMPTTTLGMGFSALSPWPLDSQEARPPVERDLSSSSSDPVRFLATGLCMGLAPANARVGDVVVRFWGCGAALVMARVDAPLPAHEDSGDGDGDGDDGEKAEAEEEEEGDERRFETLRVVGRADVAEGVGPYRRNSGRDAPAVSALEVRYDGEEGQASTRGVYVRMDYLVLQRLTASIAT